MENDTFSLIYGEGEEEEEEEEEEEDITICHKSIIHTQTHTFIKGVFYILCKMCVHVHACMYYY